MNLRRKYRIGLAAVLGVLSCAVLFGVSGPVSADTRSDAPAESVPAGSAPQVEALFGTVLEVKLPDRLIVVTDGGALALSFGSSSQLKIGGENVDLTRVGPGDKLTATAYRQSDGTYLADKVLVRKSDAQLSTRHIVGVVVEVSDGRITIQTREGDRISLDLSTGLNPPEIGDSVTTVATFDPGTQRYMSKAFQRAASTVEKLVEAADKAKDSAERDRLRKAAEDARQQHLTALEEARGALEKAREELATSADLESDILVRLRQLDARFRELLDQYLADASARGEKSPTITMKGTLSGGDSSSFILTTNESQIKFSYDGDTMATGIAINSAGERLAISEDTRARYRLADVIRKVPTGAYATVEYRPDTTPRQAVAVTFVEPELPKPLRDALVARSRVFFIGTITLVEARPEGSNGIGVVVVVSDEATGRKVVANVTSYTQVYLDGQSAALTDLAAGQKAEVAFDEEKVLAASTIGAIASGNVLDAVSISARTRVASEESYIAGLVRSVDARNGVVVIAPDRGETLRLTVPAGTQVVRNGYPFSLAAVVPGDLVLEATRYNRKTGQVLRLAVKSQDPVVFSGVISGLELTSFEFPSSLADRIEKIRALKVTFTARDGQQASVYLTEQTKISAKSSGSMGLLDIKAGDIISGEVRTLYRSGQAYTYATTVTIEKPAVASVKGVVVKLDAQAGVVVINHSRGGSVELRMPEDASVASLVRNDRPVSNLRTVAVGDTVESASFDTGSMTLLRLNVVSAGAVRLSGTISKLDARTGTVSFAPGGSKAQEPAEPVELSLSGDTLITVDGKPARGMSSITVGDSVNALCLLRQEGRAGAALSLAVASASRKEPVSTAPASSTPKEPAPPGSSPSAAVEVKLSGAAASAPEEQATVTLSGIVDRTDGATVVIISGVKVQISEDTSVQGTIKAGGRVTAVVVRGPDGTIIATEIQTGFV